MTATAAGRSPARQDYIDWLRNLAILFLFPYHTARIFDLNEPYYVQGTPNLAATMLIESAFWFMPLLFLLAGMSSCFALRSRSGAAYVRERFRRLFVPLVAGLLFLVPPQAYLAQIFHTGSAGSYADFLPGYFSDWSDLSGYYGTFTPAQLWFIAFLFLISLALLPVMRACLRTGRSPRFLARPGLVLLAFPVLACLSALPDISGKNIFVFAGYFFLGFLLAARDGIIEAIMRCRRRYLAVAAAGTAGILAEIHSIGWQAGFGAAGAAFSLLHFFIYWASLLAILGYGRRYLDRKSAAMAYLNGAGFPVFVIHQTWIVAAGFCVLGTVPWAPAQYAAVLVLSLAASLASYEVIRRTAPLRALFGVKAPRPAPAAGAPEPAAGAVRGAGR